MLTRRPAAQDEAAGETEPSISDGTARVVWAKGAWAPGLVGARALCPTLIIQASLVMQQRKPSSSCAYS
jgi:hypothetical protein